MVVVVRAVTLVLTRLVRQYYMDAQSKLSTFVLALRDTETLIFVFINSAYLRRLSISCPYLLEPGHCAFLPQRLVNAAV
jgi:hypothetical protein